MSGRRIKTNKQFKTEILDRTFESIEEYQGSKIKIQFKCDVCNHEWAAIPANILSGKGCPGCRSRNEILKDFKDGSILIDVSTKRYPSKTSRMDLEDFVKIKGRIYVMNTGYPTTMVNGGPKQVHQLVMPATPEGLEVDHINRDRCDNRMLNLRYVTHRENMQNRSDNTSGVPGVSWHKKANKWRAYIQIDGVVKSLGQFDNINEAREARGVAEELIEDLLVVGEA